MVRLTDLLISLGNAVLVLGLLFFGPKIAAPKPPTKEQSLGLAIIMLAAGFVLAKLSFGYFNQIQFFDAKNLLKYTQGGYSIKGAVVGAFSAAYLYAKAAKLPFTALTRLLVPLWCLAHALWRAGCLAAGCCHGATTQSPVALFLNKISLTKAPLNSLPLPLLEVLLMLILFLTLGPLKSQRLLDKWLLPLFLLVYFIFAYGVTFLK
jgi:phosphatidylglycerol:prolipoprotein diacylglycerol transferase